MARTSAALQLALWVGRKGKGAARLKWGEQELILHVSGQQIVGVEGDDRERLASAFGLTSGGEWLTEAQNAVTSGQVSQGEANAVVKRTLAEALREFWLAADAAVTFDPETEIEPGGLSVSFAHLAVELMLESRSDELQKLFLPDPEHVLRRLPEFLKRIGALGLTDEAMAVFAKINDMRSAQEIAEPSPHGKKMALRLLAAAVAAGLVETSPRLGEVPLQPTPTDGVVEAPPRRRWWRVLLLIIVVGALAAAAAYLQPWKLRNSAGSGGPWAIAVDGGDQPPELERLYRLQERDPANLRVVPFGPSEDKAYRLVWGRFPTRQSAEDELARLPSGLVTRGFAPHVVQVESSGP